jgi:hypothetical protein
LLEHFISGWVNAFFAALPLSTVVFFSAQGKSSNNLRTQHIVKSAKASISLSNLETNATIQENLCAVLFIESKKSKIGNSVKKWFEKV